MKYLNSSQELYRRVKRIYDVDPNLLPAQVKTLYESHFGGGVTPFSPDQLTNIVGFLDSKFGITYNGVDMASWASRNGLLAVAAQITASAQPFVQPEALGDAPGIEFDGSEFLEIPYHADLNTQEYTVLVVGREFRQATSGYYTTNPGSSVNSGGMGISTNNTRLLRHYVSDTVTNVITEVSGTKVINQWNDFYQLRRADNTAQSFSNSMGIASPSKATTLVYPGTDVIRIGRIYGGTAALEIVGQIRGIIVVKSELTGDDLTNTLAWVAANWLNTEWTQIIFFGLSTNAVASGNTIACNGLGASSYSEGAIGHLFLKGDGVVEFTSQGITSGTSRNIMGLSRDDPDFNYTSIDFGLQNNDATGFPWENNSAKTDTGAVSITGDRWSIEVASNVVTYKRNGVTWYTSLNTPSYPLILDCSMFGTRTVEMRNVRVKGSGWEINPERYGTVLYHFDANLNITLNGADISAYGDSSLRLEDISMGVAANQPLYNSADADFNGHASLEYDGATEYLQRGTFFAGAYSQPQTQFLVFKLATTTGIINIMDSGSGSARHTVYVDPGGKILAFAGASSPATLVADTDTHIMVVKWNTATSVLYLDGGTGVGSNLSTHQMNGYTQGARYDGAQNCAVKVASDTMIDVLMTDAEINEYGSMLATKYGTTWTDI